MAFTPGNKLAGSRKGVPNKRTQEVRELLAQAGFCPTSALMDVYKIAMARFIEETDLVESGRYSPMESNAHAYLKVAADMAKELGSYVNPKLKSIEQTKPPSALDGMTLEQKLAAFKQATALLEAEVKAAGGSGPT